MNYNRKDGMIEFDVSEFQDWLYTKGDEFVGDAMSKYNCVLSEFLWESLGYILGL